MAYRPLDLSLEGTLSLILKVHKQNETPDKQLLLRLSSYKLVQLIHPLVLSKSHPPLLKALNFSLQVKLLVFWSSNSL